MRFGIRQAVVGGTKFIFGVRAGLSEALASPDAGGGDGGSGLGSYVYRKAPTGLYRKTPVFTFRKTPRG